MIALEDCLAINPEYAALPFYSSALHHPRSLLLHVCHLGASVNLVKSTFQAYPDAINLLLPEYECCTALYAACSANFPCLETIKLLLAAGDLALLSTANSKGYTALLGILQKPDASLDIVKLFYEWDKHLFRRRTSCGFTALHVACAYSVGNRVLEFIIAKVPDTLDVGCQALGHTPLHVALSCQVVSEDAITLLAEKSPQMILKRSKHNGMSPLCMACCSKAASPEVIEILVANYPCTTLKLFDLVNITPATINTLFDCLNYNCLITTLSVTNCVLSEKVSLAFFQCLTKNDTFIMLQCDFTCITWTDRVFACFERCFAVNTTLSTFRFSVSVLQPRSPAMLECLILNPRLDSLDTLRFWFGDEFASFITVAMHTCYNLNVLNVKFNLMGTKGKVEIAKTS